MTHWPTSVSWVSENARTRGGHKRANGTRSSAPRQATLVGSGRPEVGHREEAPVSFSVEQRTVAADDIGDRRTGPARDRRRKSNSRTKCVVAFGCGDGRPVRPGDRIGIDYENEALLHIAVGDGEEGDDDRQPEIRAASSCASSGENRGSGASRTPHSAAGSCFTTGGLRPGRGVSRARIDLERTARGPWPPDAQ